MPTIITHGIVGLAGGKILTRKKQPGLFWIVAGLLPMLPDADVLAFAFGIPYHHVLGHRGLSHSLLFALLVGTITGLFFRSKSKNYPWHWGGYALFFTCIIATHGVLDAMTNGGLGVAFFAPFNNTRYFLPWRPIPVAPIGITRFFSNSGLKVVLSETGLIWLPLGMVTAFISLLTHGGDA